MTKIIKDISFVFISRILVLIIGITNSFFIPGLLGPQNYGLFRIVILISSYFIYAHLGILSGMNKELPFYYALNQHSNAEKIESVSFWFANFIAFIISLLIFFVPFFYSFPSEQLPFIKLSITVLAIILIINQIYSFFNWNLRAKKKFLSNSILVTLQPLFILIFSLPLIYFLNLSGAVLGLLIGNIITIIFILINYKFPRFEIDFNIVKKLFLVGFPIMLTPLLGIVLNTVEQIYILKYLTVEQLGQYGFALNIGVLIYFLPNSLASTIFPRIVERLAITNDVTKTSDYIIFPIRLLSLLNAFFIGVILMCSKEIISLFLPTFIPAIKILEILAYSFYFYSFVALVGNYYIAVNKSYFLILVQCLIIFVSIILNYILITNGFGIYGIATVSIVNYFFLFYLLMFLIKKEIVFDVNSFMLTLVPIILVAFLINISDYFIQKNGIVFFGGKLAILTSIYMILVLYFNQKYELIKKIKSFTK